jgi:hypothetical protein
MRPIRLLTLWLMVSCLTQAQSSPSGSSSPELSPLTSPDLFVKVQLDRSTKLSKLQPGDVVAGTLSEDVYLGDRELLPAGGNVRLVVDHLERRHRTANDHWPWVVKAFAPRHENYPIFHSASVFLANGHEVPLQVSLISVQREKDVHAQARKKSAQPDANSLLQATEATAAGESSQDSALPGSQQGPQQQQRPEKNAGPVVTLAASLSANAEASALSAEAASPEFSGPVTLAAGTEARVILLGQVSASRNHPGDSFQARLIQPVRLDSKVILPEGTLLEGKVLRSRRPRMLSRAGSLFLAFTGLTLPGGAAAPVQATITEAQLDQGSHTRIDPEGELRGERPGRAWMALNAGVTAGLAKEVDDGAQLLIEALISTATDASTAGAARIAATCVSTVFVLTRHGRDVVLPKFTELTIVFDRPVSLAPNPHP